jgi:frataxin-like iron-binding protein CyaY
MLQDCRGSCAARGMASRSERDASRLRAAIPFPQVAASLFDNVQAATKDMVASNAGFSVAVSGPELKIVTGNGDKVFRLTADPVAETVCLNSPKNGLFYYKYDPSRQTWVHIQDGHFLVELLTRDLIYYCKGFPTF